MKIGSNHAFFGDKQVSVLKKVEIFLLKQRNVSFFQSFYRYKRLLTVKQQERQRSLK